MFSTVDSLAAIYILHLFVSFQSQELGGDSAMDKMKKILGSPMTKKRSMATSSPSAGQIGKYFGIALEEITRREGSHIPHLVTRVCKYIKEYGKCLTTTYWTFLKNFVSGVETCDRGALECSEEMIYIFQSCTS